MFGSSYTTNRQKLKSAKPVLSTVKRWSNEAERNLICSQHGTTLCFSTSRPGVSNLAPGEQLSDRFQLQPQSSTPEPANQGRQGYLITLDRCDGPGLELKSAGQ